MSQCMKEWKLNTMIDWRGPFGNHQIQLEKVFFIHINVDSPYSSTGILERGVVEWVPQREIPDGILRKEIG